MGNAHLRRICICVFPALRTPITESEVQFYARQQPTVREASQPRMARRSDRPACAWANLPLGAGRRRDGRRDRRDRRVDLHESVLGLSQNRRHPQGRGLRRLSGAG